MMEISFVIPALNEESFISLTIDSIRKYVNQRFAYEIILVDNGSNDRTVEISREKGATVYFSIGGTVAQSRNFGAKLSSGHLIVFLDADVCLTAIWVERIGAVLSRTRQREKLVTGSLCGISDDQNWIEKTWFEPRTRQRNTNYINSGHMVIAKELFWNIGGFNALLETGEDYEFCTRARSKGCQIENDPELSVVHLGYPKTLMSFFRRERWHARGDYKSTRTILASKPAMVCCSCATVAGFCLIWALFKPESLYYSLTVFILFLTTVSLASALKKNIATSGSADALIKTFLIYLVYFCARTFSLFEVLIEKLSKKRG